MTDQDGERETGEPAAPNGGGMSRRSMLELVVLGALATACTGAERTATAVGSKAGADTARAAAGTYQPTVFTPHEWETVNVLVDIIIPRDERSGSATDAGVPEFMDRILVLYPEDSLPIRGGLAWLDHECVDRFGRPFAQCNANERNAVLDDIAWPSRAKPEVSQGVAFFNRFRDFTATGFFSSKMGVADLQYQGNTFVAQWTGCPPEALHKLGVG
ncbi:MAG TPA: gluconate 2-dehydrogenase subunit 3 family protein [Gemmatimonadaceae bacterium]|nr:gluconate 2-dehydrogenase subunit 3 family protein [Gemmatimonadaceae bacterium]